MAPQASRCIAAFALLAEAFAGTEPRRLSYTSIAGYEPGSDVVQHNRLDLDQAEMESLLGQTTPEFVKAKAIYENGAHSGAYARITVSALSAAVAKGSAVVQASNAAATGYVKKPKAAQATSVDLTYTSICVDNQHSKDYSVAACYKTTGAMTVNGTLSIGAPSAVANKYRSLAGFSTAAGSKSGFAGKATFEKFKTYYTNADYGHRYVTAALDGSGSFTGKDNVARVEGAKKGSAYLNVWMYVVREMEDAITDCKINCVKCNDDPVHAWDEGVAFYVGTLEGVDGAGSGKMLYALADKRCKNYMTCTGGTTSGTSKVNEEIMKLFAQGQAKLLQSKCGEVPAIRDAIIQQMSVPLIQGALRYAYKVDKLQGGSKEKAEGAVFAAAILPLVHACSTIAATTISNNLKINTTTPMTDGFAAVKKAFESTYSCLGITCAQVGGLILTGSQYYEGMEPCAVAVATTGTPVKAGTSASKATKSSNGGTGVAIAAVGMTLMTLVSQ